MNLSIDSTVELDVSDMLAGWQAAAVAPSRWERSVRIITTPAELDALAPAWNALAERGGPGQRVEWAQSCVATLLPPGARGLRLVSVRRDGNLVALAPLVPRQFAGGQRLEQAGLHESPEPNDLLYTDDTALRVLLAELLRQREPLALERLPDTSRIPALIRGVAGGRAWVHTSRQAPYQRLSLAIDPDQALNAGRRSDLRRALRRAERRGPVRFEILAPAPQEVDALYATVMRVEALSWKGRAGTALAQDARLRAFFHDYALRTASSGILRIALLHVGEDVAAVQYSIACGHAWWLFKIGYDASYADCSPGQLLMQHTLRAARAAGLARYELQGSSADWARMWVGTEHPTLAVRVHPWRSAALAAAATLGARFLRRRVLGR